MRLLIVAVLTMLVPVLGAQEAARPAQTAAPKGDAKRGQEIYTNYGCFQCHNLAAHGGGAGPRLAPRPIPFDAYRSYVREPKGQMPPYTAKVVSDQDLADIYAFLQTIPAPPAAESIPILQP